MELFLDSQERMGSEMVKRYELAYVDEECPMNLEECEEGDFVEFADYEQLQARCAELEQVLRELIPHCSRCTAKRSWGEDGLCEICVKALSFLPASGEREGDAVTRLSCK